MFGILIVLTCILLIIMIVYIIKYIKMTTNYNKILPIIQEALDKAIEERNKVKKKEKENDINFNEKDNIMISNKDELDFKE